MEESVSVRPAVAYRTQLTLGRYNAAQTVEIPLPRDMYPEQRTWRQPNPCSRWSGAQGLTAWLGCISLSVHGATGEQRDGGAAADFAAGVRIWCSSSDAPPLASTYAVLQAARTTRADSACGRRRRRQRSSRRSTRRNFLVEAKERGQKIPPGLMASVNDWLTQFAATPASTLDDGRLRAYAVYLLARQGIKANAALTNVEQELSHRYRENLAHESCGRIARRDVSAHAAQQRCGADYQ